MSRRVLAHRLLGRSVVDAFGVLRARDFWATAATDEHVTTHVLAFEESPTEVSVTTESLVPLAWVPAQVRRRLSSAPVVRRSVVWHLQSVDAADAVSQYEFPGMPASAQGSGRLRWTPGGSEAELVVELSVGVPLVGHVVEATVAPWVERLLESELARLD